MKKKTFIYPWTKDFVILFGKQYDDRDLPAFIMPWRRFFEIGLKIEER